MYLFIFEELAPEIMDAGKFKICGVGWQPANSKGPTLKSCQARDLGKNQYCSRILKAVGWQNSLLLDGGRAFVLFIFSTDWMKPTQIMEGNLLYTKSNDLNVNLIPNSLTRTSRITFDQIPGQCGPAKMTHKVGHHASQEISHL